MARELRSFTAVLATGSTPAAPVTTDMSFPARIVRRVDVFVPNGPNGEVGFALANSGQQIIPFNRGEFVVTNDEKLSWDLTDYIDSGSWQFIGYNTGFYAHRIQVRFHLDLPTAQSGVVTAVAPIDPALLNAPATSDPVVLGGGG